MLVHSIEGIVTIHAAYMNAIERVIERDLDAPRLKQATTTRKGTLMSGLIIPTLRTFLIGAIALGVVLFLPAWTLAYWQAWIFIVVFMTSVNAIGVYLSLKDPELLERRKNVGPAAEQNMTQKIVMSLAIIGIIAVLVVSALDYRFGWSQVPAYISLMEIYWMQFLVFKANSYGASNIQTFADQKVISTGPYALVRHPMYVGVLVMLIGVPLALGSFWGLAVLVLITPGLIWRILDEEQLLKNDLPGYKEYTQKVPYRLMPYLW